MAAASSKDGPKSDHQERMQQAACSRQQTAGSALKTANTRQQAGSGQQTDRLPGRLQACRQRADSKQAVEADSKQTADRRSKGKRSH